jgi:putative DNA primase/helicase
MENPSFPSPIIISCVTKDNGPLTKIMRLDPETEALIKVGTECSMSTGTLTRLTISSLEGFARMLRTRKDNQAIVHGIYQGAEVAKLTVKSKVSGTEKNGYPIIARTKEFIVYPDAPGVMLFDHDKPRDGSVGSAAALVSYRPADLLEILATIHPELTKAGWVSSPSSSSCIYDSAGNMLRGEGTGSHIYLFPKLASDIPRYLATLGKRLFLAGLGRIEISRSGSLLLRTLVDLLVGSQERLDFVAGAVCKDGLVQRLPPPTVRNGGFIDTTTLLDLTPEEERQYQEIVQALKNQAQPRQEKVVAEYIEREAAKLVKDGITLEDARSIVRARQNHNLHDDDILHFNGKAGTVTVGEVRDNGASYDGKSLADPLEADYEGGSKTKAKFFWNNGNPIIHSYAHGSIKYSFKRLKTDDAVWSEEDIADFLAKVSIDCGAPFTPEAVKQLAHLYANDKPRYMQLRDEIKRANNSVIITELDRDIRLFRKKKISKCSQSSSSSLSDSCPSSECSLDGQLLHFQEALITYDEEEGKPGLVIESIAAVLIGEALRGHFAFDGAGVRWLRFTGCYWQPCRQNEFDTAFSKFLYAGAGNLGFKNAYFNGVVALLQKSGRNGLPRCPHGMIPFLNGLLDVVEKRLHPTTPENAATWVLPFNYVAEATCPNFLDWLSTAVDGDVATIRLLRAWINALLTGRPDLQVFLHIIGPGGTGKSTFGRLVFILVGEENATTTSLKQLETNRFEAANIYGKRLVAIEEADKYGGSVSVLKAMTGQDPLRLERKNQQQQGSFIFEGQTLLMSNERLATTDYTSGIERRRITVEFTHRITTEDREAFSKRGGEQALLHSEAVGIINWALGLSAEEVTAIFKEMPERIRKANLAEARFNNPILDWMLSNLLPDPQAKTQVGTREEYRGSASEILFKNADKWLYPNYLTWCQRSGRDKVSLQRFSGILTDAAATHEITISKNRAGDGVKISGLRIRGDHETPWVSRIESEGSVKTDVKDNSLNMFKMKEMKTAPMSSSMENRAPYPDESVYVEEEL